MGHHLAVGWVRVDPRIWYRWDPEKGSSRRASSSRVGEEWTSSRDSQAPKLVQVLFFASAKHVTLAISTILSHVSACAEITCRQGPLLLFGFGRRPCQGTGTFLETGHVAASARSADLGRCGRRPLAQSFTWNPKVDTAGVPEDACCMKVSTRLTRPTSAGYLLEQIF